ncbi:MAG: adenine deaminase [Treponema sp.]|jgi:adenine deaminase|nr:adenine deaminase [Treponema sp.]
MDKKELKNLIDTAAGRVPADLVIRNGIIADVYSGGFIEGDLALSGGLIAALGEKGSYEGRETLDAGGLYVLPGYIDSHIHIESSFLSPSELARLLIPLGTAALIADPHEIVNVRGMAGFDYMLRAAEGLPLDIKFMAPSCVPATAFENAGAVLDAEDLRFPLENERVLGLGEMMDYEGLIRGDEKILAKILLALEKDKLIDGHSPGLSGKGLNAYMAGFIHTEHECSSPEEMRERLSRGMYIMLRQGSACRDLRRLLPAVTRENSRRCLLCSDDCQAGTILEEGHIDKDLRICVEEGLDPMTAIRMATLNPAECFGLDDRGGLAPGKRADLVLVKDLREFKAQRVFLRGVLAAREGVCLLPLPQADSGTVRGSMGVRDFSPERLKLPLSSDQVWVIDLKAGTVVTGKGRARVNRNGAGCFRYDPSLDVVKIAVVERHKNTGNVGLGLLRGYGIKRGAAALSVSHDSHNIIAAGTGDADMAAAVERLIVLGGGAVLARDGKILEDLPLPLGGLMSDLGGGEVAAKLASLKEKAVRELGINADLEPLMSLCFMSLLVIPELKISDRGLFDAGAFKFIDIEAD